MPYKEKEIEKLYYTISEVANMFDVNASLIRFWEKEFVVLKPKKNKKGNRLFTKADIENLRTIYHLVKERGFTLQGAKDQLKGSKKTENDTNASVIGKLQEIKSYLLELKDAVVSTAPSAVEPETSSKAPKKAKKIIEEIEEKTLTPEVSPNQISLFDF